MSMVMVEYIYGISNVSGSEWVGVGWSGLEWVGVGRSGLSGLE